MENYLKEELDNLIKTDDSIFEFLQQGSLDGLWYWDIEEPENEWMSKEFWTEFGYDPSKMPHKSSAWQDIINKEDLAIALENFKKHVEDPNHPYDQIVRYTHKNGSTVYIRCRGIAVRDKTGKAVRMLGAHNNITVVMNANERLKEKNKELEQYNYIISHDLQEPINSILSSSMILQNIQDQLNEDEKYSIDIIIRSSNRMKELIRSILDYSKITSPKEKTEISIEDLVEQIKTEMGDLISRYQATVNYIGENITIRATETDLTIALQNLISNGIKYSRINEKPIINIEVEELDTAYQFSVADNGIGIDEEFFEEIFKIFKRLHTRDKYEGTGIGLAHCKKIVELHNGKIWLTSEVGKGSTFYFTISKNTLYE
ncbi:MAG: ATP-binding protein [Bacteroidota bacterium]